MSAARLKRLPGYRFMALPRRALVALGYVLRPFPSLVRWLVTSREETNFTYDLTARSRLYLAMTVSEVTGAPASRVEALFAELEADEELRASMAAAVGHSPYAAITDPLPPFGRRLAWYAVARLTKPAILVETGVDKGLGAAVLCCALLRNAAEGAPGRYIGTDINPEAGWLVGERYREVATFMIGDSIESLRLIEGPVGLFINDSDHRAAYEAEEYSAIATKLADGAVILGDNAHISTALATFARATGRHFLYAGEEPFRHWYPGAGVGFSFQRAA